MNCVFFSVAVSEKIIMFRLYPKDVDDLIENLKNMGVHTTAPIPEKKTVVELTLEKTYWPIPCIETKLTGVRAHNCNAHEHSKLPTAWSCDCRYHPLDRKFLTVSEEARNLFGLSEQDIITLCDPYQTDIPFSIVELYANIIHESDSDKFCQLVAESILDPEGRSLPKQIRCINTKDGSIIPCIVRLRLSKSENYYENSWNHYTNFCFIPLSS
jgi:hypothetical protein